MKSPYQTTKLTFFQVGSLQEGTQASKLDW